MPPALDPRLGRIDADHRCHFARPHQKAHSRAVAATEIDSAEPTADSGPIRQIDRRLHTANVNLLSKYELHEVALRTAVERSNFSQSDAANGLHDFLLQFAQTTFVRTVSAPAQKHS